LCDLVVTFIGVFIAFAWNLQLEHKKTRKENEKRIEYYKGLLEDVIKKSEEQVGLICSYIEKQEQNKLNLSTLKFIPINNVFIRLKNIDNRGVFEALCDKFKSDDHWIKTYNNFNSSLDYLEGMFCREGELERLNEYTIQKGYADLLDVEKCIKDFFDILNAVLTEKKQLGEELYEEYVFINNAKKKYNELIEAKSDMKRFKVELLKPLLEDIRPYEANPHAREVISQCKSTTDKMSAIETDIELSIASYREAIGYLQNSVKRVREMVERISDSQKGGKWKQRIIQKIKGLTSTGKLSFIKR
jgi:hypothetical protein